jgi:uncharacterized protein
VKKLHLRKDVSRQADPYIVQLLQEEPAVMLEGPRGSGKSTLLRAAVATHNGVLVDLDDEATLAQIRAGSFESLRSNRLVAIDEFQRAPEVLLSVKRIVDREGGTGRFLLAGSVSHRLLPKGSETLAGRVQRMQLLPLSAGELLGQSPQWLAQVLSSKKMPNVRSEWQRRDFFELLAAGGYPGALKRPTESLRRRWLSSYLSTIADRDLPDLADVRNAGALSRLFRLVSERSANLANYAELATRVGMTPQATRNYVGLLERCFLVKELPSWTIGVSAREGRKPKLHATDTGLATVALGADAEKLSKLPLGGALLETFVLTELLKQAAVIDVPLTFAHFRDRTGLEVDIILERPDGRFWAIEVKASIQAGAADVRGLRYLREHLGERFLGGVLFHTGPLTFKMEDRIWGTPVSALWGGGT